jgi:hypothetical protein
MQPDYWRISASLHVQLGWFGYQKLHIDTFDNVGLGGSTIGCRIWGENAEEKEHEDMKQIEDSSMAEKVKP